MDLREFSNWAIQNRAWMVHVAWGYFGNKHDAEDAVQDALIRQALRLSRIENLDQLRASTFTILRNLLKDEIRTPWHRRRRPLADNMPAPPASSSVELESQYVHDEA